MLFSSLNEENIDKKPSICIIESAIALSDTIYRNKLGQYKRYIDANYLCKKLGLKKLKYIHSIIETKNITSFNNKWNCRTPQIAGIKAGNIFKYEILEGQVDKNRLSKFVNEGIGDRKVDGFSRFVIVESIEEGIRLYTVFNCGF